MSEPTNHKEAYELACYKQENSNMARSYLEIISLLEELRDTELKQLGCIGSQAPVEDLLGRIFSVLGAALPVERAP